MRYVYHALPEFQMMLRHYHLNDAATDHPNISKAVELIRSWPLGYMQCQQLLEAIHPVHNPNYSPDSDEIYRGSMCHSYEQLFGTMWATIFCPIDSPRQSFTKWLIKSCEPWVCRSKRQKLS